MSDDHPVCWWWLVGYEAERVSSKCSLGSWDIVGYVAEQHCAADEVERKEEPMSKHAPETWKSSVLRCNLGEDGCPVCEFLNGKRDSDTLLAVIKRLDEALADSEQERRLWLDT